MTGHSRGSLEMFSGANSVKLTGLFYLALLIFSAPLNSKEASWFNLRIHKENMSSLGIPARVIWKQEGQQLLGRHLSRRLLAAASGSQTEWGGNYVRKSKNPSAG